MIPETRATWPGPGVAVILVGAALVCEYSGLDLRLIDALHQPGGWTLGEGWLWNEGLHDGGRGFIKFIALGTFALFVLSLRVPRFAAARTGALLVFLSILIGAGGVNLAKRFTNVDCPWSLERYGGDRPYVHLFDARSPSLPQGRCFPGGHSSGGFALLSLFFVARARRWRRGVLFAGPGAVVGGVFAVTQWLRGAHFPSHDLWSAALCWLVAWLLYEAAVQAHGATLPDPHIAPATHRGNRRASASTPEAGSPGPPRPTRGGRSSPG